MNRPRRSELLMPAGSLEKLKVAIMYGADAVYMGTPDLSLRTQSTVTLEEVVEGVRYAHERGRRVYLTLNLFAHNSDVAKLPEFLKTIRVAGPDGVIVADPGVFHYVKQQAPELELHISTQANVCSWQAVDFWGAQGASLVVMARETTFEELSEVRRRCPDIKLEAFVHGSMCMTYSGRCLLSNFMAERGANQGSCAHSCRWNYKLHLRMKDGTTKDLELNDANRDLFEFFLEEEIRPGQLFEIEEDERGSYIMNSKDLCLMPVLDQYLRAGIDSLKVEGRNKSLYYAAMVARAYRHAIDAWYADPDGWSYEPYMRELLTVPNRGYSLAFHEGRLTNLAVNYEDAQSVSEYEFAGIVEEHRGAGLVLGVKNKVEAGDVLEFVSPTSPEPVRLRMYAFEDAVSGEQKPVLHAGQKPQVLVGWELFDREDQASLRERLPVGTVVRKEKALTPEQWERLGLDREARRMEQAERSGRQPAVERYREKVVRLRSAVDAKAEAVAARRKQPKTRRVGVEGCCGKGCNGCLPFWNEPEYAAAREKLAGNNHVTSE